MIQEVTGSRNISFLSAGFSGMPHMRYFYLFLLIAYFISFLGNTCLMFVIIMDRNLHTPKYISVFNLSLTDTFESITKIPQQLYAVLFGNQLISYGFCLCNILSNKLFVLVHSLTLTFLSFDRLVAIRYHVIVTNRSMLVIIAAMLMLALMHTIMSRLSFCRTSVIIIHFCDLGSNFPSCVSMRVLFQVIIVFPVFCIIFSYTCIAITLFTTPHDCQRAKKTCTAHLMVVAVFDVPICLTNVFHVLLSTNTIIIIYLTSMLSSVLNLIMTKDLMSVKMLIKKE
ncbi:olfactory receptor 1A1-like [Carassius carassius]|uniref:olfactory receptor 1A1-like n=1 Tax=Carassius carassius TaxID=217509 RepID=UPI00286847A4|nr:olfactory receptor 1A1-like [Carassius carassius]